MRIFRRIALLALIIPFTLYAGIEDHVFEKPQQEALYTELIKELRCLVCQNQNLADSNADLAKDLREKTYEMVIAGKTRDQITEYMITRYGDFVLYRPPVQKTTFFLWLGPFVFLLIALGVLLSFLRKKTSNADDPVSNDEIANARKHLDD